MLQVKSGDDTSVLEKSLPVKRSGDDLTGSSHKSRRGCNDGVEITDSSSSGDLPGASNLDVWTELSDEVKSKLSKSVVSLALCSGNTVVFSCSGIAIGRGEHGARFVTSARLVRALKDTKLTEEDDNFRLQVRHEGNEVHTGFLGDYDFDYNFAVVDIFAPLDVHVVLLERAVLPLGKVVTVGRDISGKLMPKSVKLTQDLSESEDRMLSCKISEVWLGGPLFYSDGTFVGMNLFLDMETAFFLPLSTILDRLEQIWASLVKERGLPLLKSRKGVRVGERSLDEKVRRDVLNKEQSEDLDTMGYPKPPTAMLDDGMVLANTFEETFGDLYGEGVWNELSKTASSNLNQNVVALASFKGETRFFACTGFFIEWNNCVTILTSASLVRNKSKIEENLRIEVLLPNKQGSREGTLEHYSLHYNIALVSVEDFHVVRPANIQPQWMNCSKVVAVGRCFKSGKLMATSGELNSWSGTLDCQFVVHSSCKITKAGIGGPLVDLDGKFVGMNFYDKRVGTPFLLWNVIRKVLASFKRKSVRAEAGTDSNLSGASFWKIRGDRHARLNRWPVPKPYWRHPGETDKTQDDLLFEQMHGWNKNYGYINGKKVMYL